METKTLKKMNREKGGKNSGLLFHSKNAIVSSVTCHICTIYVTQTQYKFSTFETTRAVLQF